MLLVRGAGREAALWPRELRERLEEASEPFWARVREAAEKLRGQPASDDDDDDDDD